MICTVTLLWRCDLSIRDLGRWRAPPRGESPRALGRVFLPRRVAVAGVDGGGEGERGG